MNSAQFGKYFMLLSHISLYQVLLAIFNGLKLPNQMFEHVSPF